MEKTGKKLVFDSGCGRFKIVVGAVANYENPNSVYVTVTSWMSPKERIRDMRILRDYEKDFRRFFRTNKTVKDNFGISTIVDMNISETRVKMDTFTYFELDFTLFQQERKNGLPLVRKKSDKNPNTLLTHIESILVDLFELDMFNENTLFDFNLKKSDAIDIMEKNKSLAE